MRGYLCPVDIYGERFSPNPFRSPEGSSCMFFKPSTCLCSPFLWIPCRMWLSLQLFDGALPRNVPAADWCPPDFSTPAVATFLTGRCPVMSLRLPGYRHRLLCKLRPALRRARCDAPCYSTGPPLRGCIPWHGKPISPCGKAPFWSPPSSFLRSCSVQTFAWFFRCSGAGRRMQVPRNVFRTK